MSPERNAPDHAHDTELPRLLALDAVIHAPLVRSAVQTAAGYATTADVGTVLDVGAGTGAGTFALAAEYPGAQVVAIDVDRGLLDGIRRRAKELRIADRISTVRADIADSDFDAGIVDLIWSSNAIHEMPDPAAAFGTLLRRLRRDGVLIVLEMDAPPMVLPQEFAPLEHALRSAAGADGPGPDWSQALVTAGFDICETRSLASDQLLPTGGPGGTYAALELRRLARHALPELTTADSAELRNLVTDLTGHHERLDHVHIRGTRTLWVARRP